MDYGDVPVKILFFAKSKELSGTRETCFRLPAKISYTKLLNIISRQFNLETIKNNVLLARNEEVCSEWKDIELQAGDHIAIIPPLSGG